MRIKSILIAFVLTAWTIPATFAQFSKSTINSQINSQFPDQTTGQITPATTRAFLANLLNSYQQYAGLNKQVGVTYTVQASDYGQLVTFNNLTTVNVTLTPANATGFTTFNFYAQNISTGNVVVTPTAGTICGNTVLTLANTQSAWIISDGTNWQCQFGLAGSQLTTPLSVNNGGTGTNSAGGTLLDNISGFTTTGFLARTSSNTWQINTFNGGLTPANITLSNLTTLCNLTGSNASSCSPGQMSAVLCTPTRTNFLTGSGNYTTATCNGVLATWLEVDVQGGGGSGSGSGTTNPTGGAGNQSSFGALVAGGGAQAAGTSAGGGGTCSGTLGIQQNITGSAGNGVNTTAATAAPGGDGGTSYYGGRGATGNNGTAGGNAPANTGGGGAGGSGNLTAGVVAGAGGGAGCHIKSLIIGPAATIAWVVGGSAAGGGAGASGNAGGNGASGQVDIWAHWQ